MTPLNTIRELSEIKGLINSVRTLADECSNSGDLLEIIEGRINDFLYQYTYDQCCPQHFVSGGQCSAEINF